MTFVDPLEQLELGRMWQWRSGLTPRPPPDLYRLICDLWRRFEEDLKHPPRHWVRYVNSEEYAVYCVIAFLQWCNE